MRTDKVIEILSHSLENTDISIEDKTKISLEFLRNLTEVKRGGNNKRVGNSKRRK